MDIPVVLTSLSTATGVLRTLLDIQKDFDTAAFKIKIGDLSTAISSAQIALSEAHLELAEKDREIARLKSDFALRGKMVELRGFRFFADDEGKAKGFAVCPRCEVVDGRLIQLFRGANNGYWSSCPQCKQEYDLRESHAL